GFAVVNVDDARVPALCAGLRRRVLPFSTRRSLPAGGWVDAGALCLRLPDGEIERYPTELPGLIGRHNQENALAAALACRALGATPDQVRSTLLTFRPLPHRMTLVAEVDGVAFFDDSKGPNVGAVAAA